MAGPHSSSQFFSLLREEHPTVGAGCCQCCTLEPRDRVDGGRMRNAKSAGDIRWPRLAGRRQQIRDELDIIFEQSCRLSRARFAEATCLRQLRWQLQRKLDSISGCPSRHDAFPQSELTPPCSISYIIV